MGARRGNAGSRQPRGTAPTNDHSQARRTLSWYAVRGLSRNASRHSCDGVSCSTTTSETTKATASRTAATAHRDRVKAMRSGYDGPSDRNCTYPLSAVLVQGQQSLASLIDELRCLVVFLPNGVGGTTFQERGHPIPTGGAVRVLDP